MQALAELLGVNQQQQPQSMRLLSARAPGQPTAYAPISSGKKAHPLKTVVAGGISGAAEAFISYPTEFVKTNMQLFEEKGRLGPIKCAQDTIRTHGIPGLYRGVSSLLYFSVPKVSIRFFGFEMLRNALVDEKGKLTGFKTLLCGLGAGVAEAVLTVTPMDTIKTRLIHDQLTRAPADRRYKGFAHGVKTIVKEQGLGGIYKGLNATIVKQGSNQAIRWWVFTKVKDAMAEREGIAVEALGRTHTVIASLCASVASVYGNTPVDVVKTRMQGLQAEKYKSSIDCAAQIWRNEGLAAFYKGATARLARVSLDVTVCMIVYNEINKLLDKVWVTD